MLDTDRLLDVGERGIHLLFDAETIHDAFEQDAERLRLELAGRVAEVHFAIEYVDGQPDLARVGGLLTVSRVSVWLQTGVDAGLDENAAN